MKKLLLVAVVVGLLLPAAETAPAPVCAAEQNHAAISIRFGPGNEQTYCVSFTEDSISGITALRRTGLRVVTKAYGGMGEFVCKIGNVGTEADDCPAGDNSHWRYFHGGKGSSSGASGTKVTCGTVEGWSWYQGGSGHPPSSNSFSSICSGKSCPQQSSAGTQQPPQQQPAGTSGGQGAEGGSSAGSSQAPRPPTSQTRAGAGDSPAAGSSEGGVPSETPPQAAEARDYTLLPEQDFAVAVPSTEKAAAAETNLPQRNRVGLIVFAASLVIAIAMLAHALLRRA